MDARSFAPLILTILLGACTPSAVKYVTLTPRPETGATVLAELMSPLGADTLDYDMSSARKIAAVVGDSAVMALALVEFEDLLVVNIYTFNNSTRTLTLDPALFSLVDGNKNQMRRLEPHEAANVFLAKTQGIPAYQPKYNYYVTTYNYGSYSSSTVTSSESVGRQLGYALAASIVRKRNQKLADRAGSVYATGLVPGTDIEPDAGLMVSVCWLNNPSKRYPLRLRIPSIGTEVLFIRSD